MNDLHKAMNRIARELELKIYKQNSKAYSQITQTFKCNTVSEALLTCDGVVKTSLLAILAIILPDMRADLQGLTSTPLGETKEEVREAVETSRVKIAERLGFDQGEVPLASVSELRGVDDQLRIDDHCPDFVVVVDRAHKVILYI